MSYALIGKELIRGVKLSVAALAMIWYDLYLMAFIAIPLLLTVLTDLVAYNILLTRTENGMLSIFGLNQLVNEFLRGPHWMHVAMGLLLLFVKVLIGITSMGALVVYSSNELKGHMLSFTTSFSRLLSHWTSLFWWAVIGTVEIAFLQSVLTADYPLTIRMLTFAASSVWYIASWLVLPLIILQHNGVRRALLTSYYLVRQNLFEVVGGVLCLLGSSIVPTVFFSVFDHFVGDLFFGHIVTIIALVLLISIKSYIQTAETLFKTMIYQKVYQSR